MPGKFEIYKDKSGKFRWRLTTANGHLIARSSGCYLTKRHAVKGLGGALTLVNGK
jgi:uncharacterized protein YegP (UPF0339 family)